MADDDLKLFVLKHGLTAEELGHLREIIAAAVEAKRDYCSRLARSYAFTLRESNKPGEALAASVLEVVANQIDTDWQS